jgi:hypothetical protein
MQDRVLDATGRAPNSHRGEVARLLNDTYLTVVERSRLNTKSATITLTSGQSDYSVATDFAISDLVAPRSLTYTASGNVGAVSLFPVSLDTIFSYREAVAASSGTGQVYAFWGKDTIALWPTPSAADTLVITYDYRPDLMSLDDDEPDAVPVEYHYVIEDGAIARSARFRPGLKDLASEANARYQAGVGELLRHRNRRQGAMPRQVTVGRRRFPLRRGNDVYYSGDG